MYKLYPSDRSEQTTYLINFGEDLGNMLSDENLSDVSVIATDFEGNEKKLAVEHMKD